MGTNRRITLFAAFALVALVGTANAQPYGPGWMMGPGMMGPGAFGRMCGPTAAGFAEWRIEQLEQVIKPTDAQRAKFNELKTASSKAADIMHNACPTDFPKTTVGRMEVMEKRADAMLQRPTSAQSPGPGAHFVSSFAHVRLSPWGQLVGTV